MFAYLEGALTYKSPSYVYLLANGIGYELNITLQTYARIQSLDKCLLYTHLQVREDAWTLYGFADEAERATFRLLLSISGVGAVTSRILLSSLTPDELERAVATDDAMALQRVKGVGGKTAQRIILELKGKLTASTNKEGALPSTHNTVTDDALIALVNLGISKSAAEAAIKKIDAPQTLTVENLIKQVLRTL